MNRLRRSGLAREARSLFGGLPRRAWLTVRHLGLRTFLVRAVTFPLRLLPFGRRLGFGARMSQRGTHARAWYRSNWRPVGIVIPTYGDPALVEACVASLRATLDPRRTLIVVADDGSAPEHLARLRALEGIELVEGEEQSGFAANANRGMRAVPDDHDVVLLNSDTIATDDWLEALQWAAYKEAPHAGIVGPKLLYPDGTIQSAGSHRNPGEPEWFDHRYRFAPADHGPANIPGARTAMTGACLYVTRETIDAIGLLDEGYAMGFEDVDWCLRAWQAGIWVWYEPGSVLTHHESKTRGTEQGERELRSKKLFWERWGPVLDGREVRTADGRLRIVFVTEDTGIGGGHRVVFEHANGLAERGHEVEIWSLDGAPDWFPLAVPVRSFGSWEELSVELAGVDAIKVATWWATVRVVFPASVVRGIPAYFVQDIETSYYPKSADWQSRVLDSYRSEFAYLTTSGWVRDRLRELGHAPHAVAPGVDLETFRPLEREREERRVLALGRSNRLKNLPLTLEAWRRVEPRPQLVLFGIEPKLAPKGARYEVAPSDERVCELLNEATAFVQTSSHEGFCLPLLEAMATGTPVVCTDADGNRDFCQDGLNCLMPEAEPEAVAAALAMVLDDEELRASLVARGMATAQRYAWPPLIDEVERFFSDVAG